MTNPVLPLADLVARTRAGHPLDASIR